MKRKMITIFYDDETNELIAKYDDNYLMMKKNVLSKFATDFVCEAEAFKIEVLK